MSLAGDKHWAVRSIIIIIILHGRDFCNKLVFQLLHASLSTFNKDSDGYYFSKGLPITEILPHTPASLPWPHNPPTEIPPNILLVVQLWQSSLLAKRPNNNLEELIAGFILDSVNVEDQALI